MSPARLSLCLIVKDEEAMLPGLLESARGLWDELVAVDTGSGDRTVALLEAAGARVLHRPWDGDFSAARNHGLEAATGDWVLFLDADERLTPALRDEVRALLGREDVGAATVRLFNVGAHGSVRESRLLRLFRRAPEVRFRFPIHEEVASGVSAMLARTGRALVHLDGQVEHLGYARAHAAARGKKERDLGLLARCLAEDPDDLYSHFKVLEQCRFWKDAPRWEQAAREARAALERARPEALLALHVGGELVVLVAEGLFPREPAQALALLEAGAARVQPSAALWLRRGELLERLGRPAEAWDAFHQALALRERTLEVQLATVRPTMGLSRLALGAGNVGVALQLAEQALSGHPRDPEALLATLFLRQAAGGADGVRAFLTDYRRLFGDTEELRDALREARLGA